MSIRSSYRLLIVAAVAVALTLAPMVAVGGETAEADRQSEPTVTLDDMTVDDAATSSSHGDTFQRDDVEDPPPLAQTVGMNALWGGITGAVVGTGVWLLTGMDMSPWVIAQFAGGGILVGGTVGLLSALATEPEPDPAALQEGSSSADHIDRLAPQTLDLNLLQHNF